MTKLFATVTAASESKPWFFSLIHQLSEIWEEQRNPPKPIQLTATPVEVPEMWSKHKAGVPRVLSVLVHAMIVALFPRESSTLPYTRPGGWSFRQVMSRAVGVAAASIDSLHHRWANFQEQPTNSWRLRIRSLRRTSIPR